jgi:predicted nucleic acid-binding protein
MMVLDTSALIELVHDTEKGRKVGGLLEGELAATTAITVNEMMAGAKESEKEILLDLFQSLEILSLDGPSAYKSAEIEQALKKKGRPIGKMDLLISGICIQHTIPLITADRDFKHIPELEKIMI